MTRDATLVVTGEDGQVGVASEVLAILGHELRAPLMPMRAALDVLAAAPDDPARVLRCRDTLVRQLSQLTRLVDDLVAVVRLARDPLAVERVVLGLGPVFDAAVEMVAPAIARAGHQLAVTPPPVDAIVLGDAGRLTQVVSNLLHNACKYTPHGGHLALAATVEGDQVIITVRDDGLGIAAELLPRIFDPFVQAGDAAAHREGGMGLGLALVQRLVALHGGQVTAHSEGAGRGTEVRVTLPRIERSRPA